jgi:lysozyme
MQGAGVILTLLGGLLLMSFPRRLNKAVSRNGIAHIKRVEGERFDVYRDAAGHMTVGVGHLVLPQDLLRMGDTITPAHSDKLLRADLLKAEDAVNSSVIVPLNQNQFDALVSFVFNIGTDNFRRSSLLRKLNEYDYQGALAEMERWNKITNPVSGQKIVNAGLVNRRRLEQDLFVA